MTPHDPALPPACVSARALIDRFLVDDLAGEPASALSRHLATCPACAAELGGATLLIRLLGSMPAPAPAPDLDRRIVLAALEDRERRHAHRSWLADLRTQIVRGAIRTTGTLVATVVAVALLGATLVLAASTFIGRLPLFAGGATIPTVTPMQSVAPSTPTWPATSLPGGVVVTQLPVVGAAPSAPPKSAEPPTTSPAPTVSPAPAASATPSASPEPTAAPTASPGPTPTPAPTLTPAPTASATPTPTPTPTPVPTEKPRRTPPPTASPSPSDTAAPDAATPTPLP